MTPGGWLAAFRYRTLDEAKSPLSPEALGARLGVSGATVRRWESGQSKPGLLDTARFAEACELSPLETGFIERAIQAHEGDEKPPTQEAFDALLQQVEAADFPVFLMDNFLFVRARNAYADAVQGSDAAPGVAPHPLAFILNALNTPDPKLRAVRETSADRWLREFWFWTASLCGTSAYRRMVRSLARYEGFGERWTALGLERRPTAPSLVGGPYSSLGGENGAFRTYPVRIFVPPLYTFAEFVPMDAVAQRRLDEVRSTQPKAVITNAHSHWSEDPILPDGTFDLGRPPESETSAPK